MPESLGIRLSRPNGRYIVIHSHNNTNQNARSNVPAYNRGGQRNDIPNPPCEVQQQAEVAKESEGQRNGIQNNLPVWIWYVCAGIVCSFGQLSVVWQSDSPF